MSEAMNYMDRERNMEIIDEKACYQCPKLSSCNYLKNSQDFRGMGKGAVARHLENICKSDPDLCVKNKGEDR